MYGEKIFSNSIKEILINWFLECLVYGAMFIVFWFLFSYLPIDKGLFIGGVFIIFFIYFRIKAHKRRKEKERLIRKQCIYGKNK